MTDELDSLRDTEPAQSDDAASVENVLVDYNARTGNDGAHEHIGPHVFTLADRSMWAAQPGLNIVSAEIALELSDDPRLTVVDDLAELRQQRAGRAMHDLAKRSMSPDALELMLREEMKRPQSGGPSKRRDGRLVELLESRVQRSMRARGLDVSGVTQAANQQSAAVAPA